VFKDLTLVFPRCAPPACVLAHVHCVAVESTRSSSTAPSCAFMASRTTTKCCTQTSLASSNSRARRTTVTSLLWFVAITRSACHCAHTPNR
jgi:hypothetical protein